MVFKDYLNPTSDELKEWAKTSPKPTEQDWDLIIATHEYLTPTVIQLSCEDNPNRVFFLRCLYILSGNNLGDNPSEDYKEIEKLFRMKLKGK